MIRQMNVLVEDDERIALVSTAFLEEFADWSGPFDVRVVEDPYREGYVEIELKKSSALRRVTT